jgi:hypothetical protein
LLHFIQEKTEFPWKIFLYLKFTLFQCILCLVFHINFSLIISVMKFITKSISLIRYRNIFHGNSVFSWMKCSKWKLFKSHSYCRTWISFVNNEKVYINLKNCKNKVNDISFIVLIMLINSMFISICDSTRQQHMQLSLIGCLT